MVRKVRDLDGLEIATTQQGRDITRGYVDRLPYLPPTDRVLRLAGGWAGYEELLRDDQVHACFQQRRHAVVSRPWVVEPGGDRRIDRQAADLLRETVEAIDFDAITDQMLYARFFGFAVAEIIWRVGEKGIAIQDIKVRDRARFLFSTKGELLLRTVQHPDGERLPPFKFWVVAVGASHHDEPYGHGLAQALYWPCWFKRHGARFWATYLEKFAAPTVIGTFPAGTDEAARVKLLEAVDAIQTETGIILPEGMRIELIEATRSGHASYEAWLSYWDRAIAKIILGQTMTTEDGSSRAQAEIHLAVRDDIVRADADLICESANRTWVRWLIDAALPGAAYPKVWRDMSDPEDLDRRADRDLKLMQIGYRLSPTKVQDIYGDGYEPLQPGPSARDGLVSASEQKTQGVVGTTPSLPLPDSLIADRLEVEAGPAWTEIMDFIQQLLARANSLSELRDALIAAYGDLPSDRLAEIMTMAFAAAELAGRFDAVEDSRR